MIRDKNYSDGNYDFFQFTEENFSLNNFIDESNKIFDRFKKEIQKIIEKYKNIELKKLEDLVFIFKNLITHYINNLNSLALKIYEPQLQKYESQLRNITKMNLLYKMQKDLMENKFKILEKKNNEYEKLKKTANVIVENGEFIFTDRKENEIIILRTENSNLKKELNKLEEIIKIKEEEEKRLINEYEISKKIMQKKINELTYKIESNDRTNSKSNININFNDISNSNLFINNCSESIKKENKYAIKNLKMTKVNTTSNIFSENKSPIKTNNNFQYNYTYKKSLSNIQKKRNNYTKKINQEFSFPSSILKENSLKKGNMSPIKKIQTFTPVNNKKEKRNISNNFYSYNKSPNNLNLSQRDVNTLFMNSKCSVNNFLIYRNVLNTNNSGNSIHNQSLNNNNGYFTIRLSSGQLGLNKNINNNMNHSYKSFNCLIKK